MPGNASNTTNATGSTNATAGGGAPPIFDDGGGGGPPGLDVAAEQLNRIQSMLADRLGGVVKGIQTALDNLGLGLGEVVYSIDPETTAAVMNAVSSL